MSITVFPLIISEHDYQRLLPLTEKYTSLAAEALEAELSRAEIVLDSDFPKDVVCMDSSVTFIDLDTREQSTVSLVFPADTNIEKMKISIFISCWNSAYWFASWEVR